MSEEIKDNEKEIKPKKPVKAEAVEKPVKAEAVEKPVKAEAVEKPVEDFGGLVAFIRDGVTILRNVEESNGLAKAGWVKK